MNTWVHTDPRYGEIKVLDLGARGIDLHFPTDEKVCCTRCHRMISSIVSKDGKSQRVQCVRTLSGLVSRKEHTPSYCPMNYLKRRG